MADKTVKEDAKLTGVTPDEQSKSNHNARNDFIRSGGKLGDRPVKNDIDPYGTVIRTPDEK